MAIKCLKCGYVISGAEGVHLISKCPNCGNTEIDKFLRVDDEIGNSIIRIMTELLSDVYPNKTAIITYDPLSWLKTPCKPPAIIFDLSKMARTPRSEELGFEEKVDTDTIIYEPLQFSELRKRIQDLDLLGLGVDHTLIQRSRQFGEDIGELLPQEFSKMHLIEEVAGILSFESVRINIQKIASAVPLSILSSITYLHWRQYILKDFNLRVVLELPSNAFLPYSHIKMAILCLEKLQEQKRPDTLFFSLGESGSLYDIKNQVWFKDFQNALSGASPTIGFFSQVPSDGAWNSGPYNPVIADVEALIGGLAKWQKLGDIFDIFYGIRFERKSINGKSGIPIICGRDLSNPNIQTSDLDRFRIRNNIPERARLQPGDILIQVIGKSPSSILVTAALEGAVAGNTVFVLRPTKSTISSEPIVHFLQSDLGQRLIKIRRSGISLNISVLREIPVPVLPPKVCGYLDEMTQIERILHEQAEKTRSMRLGLFSIKDRNEFRKNLQLIRTHAEILSSSIMQISEFEFQMRNFYPYPVIYPFRLLDSALNPLERYRDQLRTIENLLAFLGSILLAVVGSKEKELMINLKKFWQGGLSPGHWEKIITQSVSVLKDFRDEPLISELYSLWRTGKRETKFSRTIRNLIPAINDFKHQRYPHAGEEFEIEYEKINKDLKGCLDAISFFIHYPIRFVFDLDIIRGMPSAKLCTLRLVGDHPALPKEEIMFPEPLSKNRLYIEVSQDKWICLYPFVTFSYCLECKTRETFFIDRWQGIGKPAMLKSFEKGHELESTDVIIDLERFVMKELI